MRGRALVLILAFLAGSAASWKCVWSCWETPAPTQTTTSGETCHRAESGGSVVFTAGESCGPEQPRLSPFVKVSAPPTLVMVVVNVVDHRHFPAGAQTPASVDPPDPGPPGARALVPLRI